MRIWRNRATITSMGKERAGTLASPPNARLADVFSDKCSQYFMQTMQASEADLFLL